MICKYFYLFKTNNKKKKKDGAVSRICVRRELKVQFFFVFFQLKSKIELNTVVIYITYICFVIHIRR